MKEATVLPTEVPGHMREVIVHLADQVLLHQVQVVRDLIVAEAVVEAVLLQAWVAADRLVEAVAEAAVEVLEEDKLKIDNI